MKKEFDKKNKKKMILIAVLGLAVLMTAGVVIFFFCGKKEAIRQSLGRNNPAMEGMAVGEGIVSASGVTSIGITQASFEVEGLTEGLFVEEVYVSSGEIMEEGTKVLKLSAESVAAAKEELEKELKSADLAYRAGAIEYEQNKITAQYDKEMAVLEGQQAQSVYDETVSSLSDSVERAQEALEETNEQIAEYREIVNGEDYYETFQVGEYKALYDDNLKLLVSEMEKYGFTWEQVVSGGNAMGSSMGENISGSMERTVSDSDAAATGGYHQQLSVAQSLYKVLEQNLADYEQAQTDYEDAVANAQLNLQTLELQVSSLEESVSRAQADYETQLLQAKLTMEQTLTEAKRAEKDYETALEKAESDYEALKDAKEDAEENLALFESTVGDGYYYAPAQGTIMKVMIRKEQYLNEGSVILVYNNPEEMTVTVSVEQSDVASIEVGENVYISSAGNGSFNGRVTGINPVSQSDSRTNVTYEVTVVLTEDAANLGTNETVTVIFGIGGAPDEKED